MGLAISRRSGFARMTEVTHTWAARGFTDTNALATPIVGVAFNHRSGFARTTEIMHTVSRRSGFARMTEVTHTRAARGFTDTNAFATPIVGVAFNRRSGFARTTEVMHTRAVRGFTDTNALHLVRRPVLVCNQRVPPRAQRSHDP